LQDPVFHDEQGPLLDVPAGRVGEASREGGQVMFGYQHTCTHDGDRCPDFDVDPFITATVDLEVADDEFSAVSFRQAQVDKGGRWTGQTIRHYQRVEAAKATLERARKAWAEEARLVYGAGDDLMLGQEDATALIIAMS
jgi:hypothetical protein